MRPCQLFAYMIVFRWLLFAHNLNHLDNHYQRELLLRNISWAAAQFSVMKKKLKKVDVIQGGATVVYKRKSCGFVSTIQKVEICV